MQYPRIVIPHRRPRIRMRDSLLHMAQRYPGVQRRGDECVAQRVRGDKLGDPGAASRLADDPTGGVPVQPSPVRGQEHRPFSALADGQVDRPCRARRERDSDDLAAFAGDGQCVTRSGRSVTSDRRLGAQGLLGADFAQSAHIALPARQSALSSEGGGWPGRPSVAEKAGADGLHPFRASSDGLRLRGSLVTAAVTCLTLVMLAG